MDKIFNCSYSVFDDCFNPDINHLFTPSLRINSGPKRLANILRIPDDIILNDDGSAINEPNIAWNIYNHHQFHHEMSNKAKFMENLTVISLALTKVSQTCL